MYINKVMRKLRDQSLVANLRDKTISEIVDFCDNTLDIANVCYKSRESMLELIANSSDLHRRELMAKTRLRYDITNETKFKIYFKGLAAGLIWKYGFDPLFVEPDDWPEDVDWEDFNPGYPIIPFVNTKDPRATLLEINGVRPKEGSVGVHVDITMNMGVFNKPHGIYPEDDDFKYAFSRINEPNIIARFVPGSIKAIHKSLAGFWNPAENRHKDPATRLDVCKSLLDLVRNEMAKFIEQRRVNFTGAYILHWTTGDYDDEDYTDLKDMKSYDEDLPKFIAKFNPRLLSLFDNPTSSEFDETTTSIDIGFSDLRTVANLYLKFSKIYIP